MAADIVKAPHLAVATAQDDDGGRADLQRQVIARSLDLADIAGEQPVAGKHRLQIGAEHLVVDIERLRQAESAAALIQQALQSIVSHAATLADDGF